MKEFYKDLHLTYLKGKTSNLKLFKWEVSEEILNFSWSERKTPHITSISGGKSCLMLVYKLMNHTCLSWKFTYYHFWPLSSVMFKPFATLFICKARYQEILFPETDDCILWLSLKGFKENRCKLLFWWKWVLNTAML